MKRLFQHKWSLVVTSLLTIIGFGAANLAYAEESEVEVENETEPGGISISITPVVEEFTLESNSVYDGQIKVTNAGAETFDFEVYSAPFSFAASEDNDGSNPDYSNENNYTQIARWITIKDKEGNYVSSIKEENSDNPVVYTAAPGEEIQIDYRINTPDNIPAGGQYAVLFAQTRAKETEASGISAQGALGVKIVGRSLEGVAITSADINNMTLSQSITKPTEVEENGQLVVRDVTSQKINGRATIKNTGNVDFTAIGQLKVTNLFGEVYYETPASNSPASISVIPDAELSVSDVWEDTPSFGLFRATWTVTAGDATETTEMLFFLVSPFVIVLFIILLTILIVWIILMVRRRKERRSRFAV